MPLLLALWASPGMGMDSLAVAAPAGHKARMPLPCHTCAGVYANNRASGLLRSNHPLCLAPMVEFNGDDLFFGMTKVRSSHMCAECRCSAAAMQKQGAASTVLLRA